MIRIPRRFREITMQFNSQHTPWRVFSQVKLSYPVLAVADYVADITHGQEMDAPEIVPAGVVKGVVYGSHRLVILGYANR
jgi:hypothetical protein